MAQKYDEYWQKTGAHNKSDDFKDLMIKMLNYDPEQRPSLEEIINHPWFNIKIDHEQIRNNLKSSIQ